MSNIMETNEINVNEEDANNNKVYGILSYIGILFIIPLLAAKESPFAKFHANQGLVAFLTQLIVHAAGTALCALFAAIHLGGLAAIVGPLVSLASLALSVIGIIYAAQGKAKELPIIGKFHILDSENNQQ